MVVLQKVAQKVAMKRRVSVPNASLEQIAGGPNGPDA
jgi:hypothetical protein